MKIIYLISSNNTKDIYNKVKIMSNKNILVEKILTNLLDSRYITNLDVLNYQNNIDNIDCYTENLHYYLDSIHFNKILIIMPKEYINVVLKNKKLNYIII